MKPVLLNDYKLFRNNILVSIVILFFMLGFLTYAGIHSIKTFVIVFLYTTRGQIIFFDEYNDFDKFMVMPVSIEEYTMAKMVRNITLFVITSIILIVVITINSGKINKDLIEISIYNLLIVDLTLINFCYVLFTKFKNRVINILYMVLVMIGISPIIVSMTFLLKFRIIFIILSIILPIVSSYSSYKLSLKNLKRGKI